MAENLAQKVFGAIEESILNGTYPSGALLSENKLSSELGVSRTPVREAIRRLEAEGLVSESGKGITVLGVTAEDVRDVYEIRLRIEGLATARCAERISAEQIDELKKTLRLMQFFTEQEIPEQIRDTDTLFHEKIYEFCGSATMRELLMTLHRKVARFRHLSVQDSDRAKMAAAEHLAILDSIEKRDPALAEKLTSDHIRNARDSILGHMK